MLRFRNVGAFAAVIFRSGRSASRFHYSCLIIGKTGKKKKTLPNVRETGKFTVILDFVFKVFFPAHLIFPSFISIFFFGFVVDEIHFGRARNVERNAMILFFIVLKFKFYNLCE